MYDSYIKAFRWATDRLSDIGIIAFITNSGWIDSNAGDMFRKSIENDFSDIYVFNLRGSIRANMGNKEAVKREGGNIFGILTGVAITLLVKEPNPLRKQAEIHYYEVGDYLSASDKLYSLKDKGNMFEFRYEMIQPNKKFDWINQRKGNFESYVPLVSDENNKSYFSKKTSGVKTNRDSWVYNASLSALKKVLYDAITFYNSEMEKKRNDNNHMVEMDERKFSWDRQNLKDIASGKQYSFNDERIRLSMYRPFYKENLYFDRQLNNCVYQIPHVFPVKKSDNYVICVPGIGITKGFTCFIANAIPDYEISGKSQCFPLYWYEERKASQASLFDDGKDKYIRHDAITDFILKRAREQYGDKVTKEDIFYYVYGFLHCPAYRETFANDLKKMLPRLPLVEKPDDFWAFSHAGRELAELHLNYEQVPASKDVVVDWHNMLPGMMDSDTSEKLYRVEQMKFGKRGKDKDKSVIEYNQFITLRNIPLRAYDYVVNGKSAIEWIMERYCDKVDSKSGIRNDANQWGIEHGNPKYPLELLQSIITLSLRTLDIIDKLPKITFD